jgi:hypothetical protein
VKTIYEINSSVMMAVKNTDLQQRDAHGAVGCALCGRSLELARPFGYEWPGQTVRTRIDCRIGLGHSCFHGHLAQGRNLDVQCQLNVHLKMRNHFFFSHGCE